MEFKQKCNFPKWQLAFPSECPLPEFNSEPVVMLPNNNWTPFEILNLLIDDFLAIVVEKTNQAFQFRTRESSRDEYFQILNRVELKKKLEY